MLGRADLSLTHRKAKALQLLLQPAGQPSIQETLMVTEYTSADLIDTAAKFRQKAKDQGKYPGVVSVAMEYGGDGISLSR